RRHLPRLLPARRERPRRRAAECDQQFSPSDGDCHTPLPCEVRKGNHTTPSACSLYTKEAACWLLPPMTAASHRLSRRAAEQRDEVAALHSITSSARASTDAGISRPSALAVLRLITRSYLVGACTGRSAGLSPLRMRSM